MFTIDLKDPNQVTLENVSLLLASGDDNKNLQLRVTSEGIVYLSEVIGNLETDNLAFRLESWLAGNDYVGITASKDQGWVNRILKVLQENWPDPTMSFIDHY